MSDEISVVIVTFQNEKEIAVCLDSILEELESYPFQIIVVDNNSQDRTEDLIHGKFSGKIEFISNGTNVGFTKAINQGLKKCTGSYILTLNPDTEFRAGSLDILLEGLKADKKIGVVAPQLLNSDGSIQPSCRQFPRRRDIFFELIGLSYFFQKSRVFNAWKMAEFDHKHRRKVDQPQGACLLFRREVLENVGFWDERFPMFFSDVDWCRRVKQSGLEIIFEPAAKVIHHQGVSIFKVRSKMIWSSHRSFYRYFKKGYKGVFNLILNEVLGLILIVTAVVRITVTKMK